MDYLKIILNKSKWTSFSAFTLILSQFFLYLIITRYVNAEDLGLYALASSIVIIPVTLIEFSFSSSLIHQNNPQPKDFRSVLTLNFITAIVATVLCAFVAIMFTYFYDNQKIWHLVFCLLPVICLSAFNNVHFAGLKKDMLFERLSALELASALISFVASLSAILLGFGIWSLVILLNLKYLITTVGLISAKHLYCNFQFEKDKVSLAKHFNFGKYILGEKGISSILSYMDVFLISSFLGVSTLGIYDVLKRILLRPILILYTAIESVVVPLLSKHNPDNQKYRRVYNEFISLSNYFFIPLLMFCFIFADWILLVLPDSYHAQGPIFQSLAILGIAIIVFNPTDVLLYSKGKTKLFFKWLMAYSVPQLLIMFLSIQHSLMFFIYALAFFYLLMHCLAYFVLFKADKSIMYDNYFRPVVISLIMFVGYNFLALHFMGTKLKAIGLVYILTVLVVHFLTVRTPKQIT